ncbi:MAG: NAD(P)H-dependent oxidoreductase subunit E [Deltaproteobacteria bacterium]|nr:NAD(P)H-dependent oxidoreductase subunit E [Deltaproteobacteria bacterium]
MAAPFDADQQARFDAGIAKLLSQFPNDRKQAAMMGAVRLVQELVGWVPPEGMEQVAQKLEVPVSKVLEVATFYVMFFTKKPGKYVIDVCTNISCSLCGAEKLLEGLERKLDVHAGETTADGKFTLREAECLGSCHTAPCLQINEDHHENLSLKQAEELLAKLA